MKRFLKIAFIIPILFLLSIFTFACGEISMQSISLSISDEYAVYLNGYYYVNKTDKSIEIETEINPNDFGVEDLSWKSNNTRVVTVFNSSNKFRTVGVGEATITASYKNKDGKTISDSLRLIITESSPDITFSQSQLSRTYNGEDQKHLFIADQEGVQGQLDSGSIGFDDDAEAHKIANGGKFFYRYYNYAKKQYVDNITNAGAYKIICSSIENNTIQTIVDVEIKKYKFNISAKNDYEPIKYGDQLPIGLYNDKDTSGIADYIAKAEDAAVKGVGADSDSTVGKKVNITSAKQGSRIGNYVVDVYFELDNSFSANYESTAVITKASFNITTKPVVLVIDNQDITYGQHISPDKFEMYSKESYDAGDLSTDLVKISNSIVDYKSSVYLGTPTYKIKTVTDEYGDSVTLNQAGFLDVPFDNDGTILSYGLFYYEAASRGNVEITEVVNGIITINQREIAITPHANQFKYYSEKDPETIKYDIVLGSFVYRDVITPFLTVNYDDEEINNEGNDDVGNSENPDYRYNFMAPVRANYGYKINNELNKNYIIRQSSDEVYFEVKPFEVYVEFEDVNDDYKTPNGNGGTKHTLSYFSKIGDGTGNAPNYITNVKSLKINNIEYVGKLDTIKGENFDEEGTFNLLVNKTPKSETPTIETIYTFTIMLNVNKTTTTQDFFVNYNVQPELMDGDNLGKLTYTSSKLNLRKITLIVTPTTNEQLMSKEYDSTSEVAEDFGCWNPTAGPEDVYFELSDDTVDLSAILSINKILTLTLDNNYIKIKDDGSEENLSNMANVGKYKVMLAEIEEEHILEGYKHYEIKLDESKIYYYTVKPKTLTITPKPEQRKTYAAMDLDKLAYVIDGLPEDSQLEEQDGKPYSIDGHVITGSLVREVGESVGEYKIKLGNLNFGDNFVLSLAEQPVYFKIVKRGVKVTPMNYTITYGEDVPSQIGFEKELISTLNERINPELYYKEPIITGNFEIKGDLVGNYYKAGNYDILQGSVNVNSDNYYIDYQEATLTVKKRPAILNIKAQDKKVTDTIDTTGISLDNQYFELTNTVDAPIIRLNVDLEKRSNIYVVINYELGIEKNSNNLIDSYDVSLGKDVVYKIELAMIYLKLVNRVDGLNETTTVTYTATERENTYSTTDFNPDFKLVTESDDFEIIDADFNFKYFGFDAAGVQSGFDVVRDAGSYTVSIDLSGEGSQIVILNKKTYEEITFNNLEENVVGNYALSISNVGYLNIEKANITVSAMSDLEFESTLEYGSEELSNVKVKNEAGQDVFIGVNGKTISLKEFEGELNFKTKVKAEELKQFNANEDHLINICVEAEDNNNYNPLYVDVKLRVVPKDIEYVTTVRVSEPVGGLVYDGRSKAIVVKMSTTNDATGVIDGEDAKVISYRNEYVRLATNYDDDGGTTVYYYEIDGYNLKAEAKYIKPEEIKGETFVEMNINGTDYIVLDGEYAYAIDRDQDDVPRSAGVYLCITTCQTDSNHKFVENDGETLHERGQNVRVGRFYAVARASLELSLKQTNFKYTTPFDFNHPDTLPFEIENLTTLPEEVRNNIQYSLDGDVIIPNNNLLNMGDYVVNIKISTKNYYVSQPHSFKVEALDAEIIYPTNSYFVYNGKAISSFMENIGAVLKDVSGQVINTIYWSQGNNDFTFTIQKVENDGTEGSEEQIESLSDLPGAEDDDIGNYVLNIKYASNSQGDQGASNYEGSGRFYYSIVKKAYSGSIGFADKTIVYNPTITGDEFYDLVIGLFSINLDSSMYKLLLEVKGDPNLGDKDVNFGEFSKDAVTFDKLKEVYKAGNRTLYLTIVFNDGITASTTLKANLQIQQYTLFNSDIDFIESGTEYNYNGYERYHALKFNDRITGREVELIPNATNRVITHTDGLGNEVVTITYEYYYITNSGEEVEMTLGEDPIKPNVSYNSSTGYVVKYTINMWSNYKSNDLDQERVKTYIINKTELYISFSDDNNREYSGEGLSEYTPYGLKIANNNGATKTNMRYKIIEGNVDLTGQTYNNTDGVLLRLSAYKGNDYVLLTNVKNAGDYTIRLSLYNSENYLLSDFFTQINIGGQSYSVEGYVGSGYPACSNNLKINQAQYTVNNLKSIFTIGKGYTTDVDVLILKPDATININNFLQDLKIVIKEKDKTAEISTYENSKLISIEDLVLGGDLVEGKTYVFVIDDSSSSSEDNYEKSEIKFKITTSS